MVCSKFETSGLLYVSGELSESDARGYESHLSECEECRRETESYKAERAAFYTAEMLGDAPSPDVDAEILRLCSNRKKAQVPAALFPVMFIKKYAPIPVFLMLIAVAVGGYVKYHSISADNLRAQLVNDTAKTLASSAQKINTSAASDLTAAEEIAGGEDDLALTGANDSGAASRRLLGNMNMEGVVPVSDSN